MTRRLKKWLLAWLIRDQVLRCQVAVLYRTIYTTCQEEFYEDNQPTLNAYLTERFDAALKPKETGRGEHPGTQEYELRAPYLS